ncbi:amidohydrolase family protein [Thalassobaculum sp. OXR-137]|uniref:amidohydrolase family protein n=1 Tax=Thalassobaculum sp. OXR-137 TaxID=3100173 RepID=UPI002AC9C201|nr:amidohydrolase family protein [Thalassobaculum sp. OXR-137]WPZ36081.1 amidohydrolase family protein [Thalassobaculum sp. OXR-137]
MTETRFRNARLPDGRAVDIVICDGLFAAFEDSGGTEGEDLGGKLVLPGLIDGHIHLDKTFLGLPWRPHRAGPSVPHRIAAEKEGRSDLSLSVEQRAKNFLAREAANGTVALRSHVDIDPDSRLDHLHQVMAARDAFAGIVDVQLVAFPQSGVLIAPGVADLLDAALSEGVELIGGIDPVGIEGDMEGHLDLIFGLADKHGVGVDIHLHDPGHRGALELRAIAQRTAALGLQGKVTVSHAFALATVDDRTLDLTIADLRDADVAILTSAPGTGNLIPVVKLREAGIRVFAGSDNVRDAWSPFGNGDMLERAMLVAYRAGLRTDEGIALAFDLCTGAAAQAIGYGPYGLEPGARADFVAVEAETLAEAVVDRPMRSLVVKGGRVTARDGAVL